MSQTRMHSIYIMYKNQNKSYNLKQYVHWLKRAMLMISLPQQRNTTPNNQYNNCLNTYTSHVSHTFYATSYKMMKYTGR